jgi:hypothetical protein
MLGLSGVTAADGPTGEGEALKAVHAYLKEVELTRIVAAYSSGDNGALSESQAQKFKEAVAAAKDKQSLIDALKAVRGAEIAVLDHASAANRANLDKAVGAAKVELELAE